MRQITDINFTQREIDILAYLLGGRSAKRIASFLDISPRTVEHHIRNIMMKLECHSQEKIKDLIQKSELYHELTNHYARLQVDFIFSEELRKIASELRSKTIICLFVCEQDKKEERDYFTKLAKYLSTAGVTSHIEIENHPTHPADINTIHVNNKINPIHFMIQYSSDNTNILKVSKINTSKESIISTDLGTLHLTEVKNHYHVIFMILQKLFPELSFVLNIEAFEKNSKPFLNTHFLNPHYAHLKKNNPLKEYTWEQSRSNNLTLEKPRWNHRFFFILGLSFLLFFLVIMIRLNYIEFPYLQHTKTKTDPIFTEWKLPRQDQLFIGRKTYLKELTYTLHKKNKPVVIAGLGGSGKTQLALQYIHHNKHPNTLRAWFRCENMLQLQHEYIKFCTMLGFSQTNPSLESAQIFLKNWLARHPGWLIVYDNVNSYEEIKPFLPEKGGEVIITSRLRYWPNNFEVLSLEVMPEAESIQLLKSIIRRDVYNENRELIELAGALGHLPLALTQAGAYIYQTHIKISEYLKLFKNHEAEVLANTSGLVELQDKISVASTWNISLKQLTKDSIEKQEPGISLDLLMMSAYLAPEKISKDLLLIWLKETYPNLPNHELTLSKIITQLARYSLIHMETDGDICLHRLLQSVLRYQHAKKLDGNKNPYPTLTLEWYNKILNAFRTYYRIKDMTDGEIRDKNYLAHLQSLETHDKNLWPNSTRPELGRFLRTITAVTSSQGDQKTALHYSQQALRIAQRYPENKIDLGICFNNLGSVYYWQGDPKRARPFFEKGLQLVEEEPNWEKNNLFYPIQISNVGQLHSYFGEYKRAKELLEFAGKLIEQHYGPEHPWKAWNLLWLGELYTNMGESKQALEFLNKSLNISMKYYDENAIKFYCHNYCRVGYNLLSLGKAYRRIGDTDSAIKVLNNAIKIYQNIYGEEGHVFIAKYLTQLGIVYNDLKKPKQSKKVLDQALRIQMQFYEGQEQCPDIMDTKAALGVTYNDLRKFNQSKDMLEDALKMQEQYYGNNHLNVGVTLYNLSKVYANLNETKKVQNCLQRSHNIFLTTYGKDHPLTKASGNQAVQS